MNVIPKGRFGGLLVIRFFVRPFAHSSTVDRPCQRRGSGDRQEDGLVFEAARPSCEWEAWTAISIRLHRMFPSRRSGEQAPHGRQVDV